MELPPLRGRVEDIPALCSYFIRQFNKDFGLAVEGVSDDLLQRMQRYDWPGNVRELRNLLEATVVKTAGGMIQTSDTPERFPFRNESKESQWERDQLLSMLVATNWNKSQAAARLRYSRMTLYRKLARYKIETEGVQSGQVTSRARGSVAASVCGA